MQIMLEMLRNDWKHLNMKYSKLKTLKKTITNNKNNKKNDRTDKG